MQIIKLYKNSQKPEFMHLIRQDGNFILVNYPLEKRYGLRTAKWIDLDSVHVDWIRDFSEQDKEK